ncbi:serine/threonine kinase 16 [Rhexocercosporidium sp. MPI-PUGE-AT-0058]|nr:serine/threonine kinase 16 [Rhexocercosporidium sp. MPI-PUGE-AT-0058]
MVGCLHYKHLDRTALIKPLAEDVTIILQPQPSEDPNDPLNWSNFRKTVNFSLVLFYTLLGFAVITVQTPLWAPINEELGFSYTALNNGYATNVAALAVGCVFFVPVALKYGRRPIYLTTTLLMLLSCIWQAKMTNLADLYLSVFLSGLASAVNEALIQITVEWIADLFFVHQRGTMNGIYIIIVAIGNYLGPVASGYIANSQGWAWSFWWTGILFGIANVLMLFFYEETKYIGPIMTGLRQADESDPSQHTRPNHSGAAKEKETLGVDPVPTVSHPTESSVLDNRNIPLKSYRERLPWFVSSPGSFASFIRHIYQPFQVMVLFPIVTFACFQYGTAISFCLPPYSFGTIAIGNLNIAPFIGFLLGAVFGGPVNDWLIIRLARRNKGIYEPEMRFHLYIIPVLAVTAGLLMYGLTLAKGMHWILPAVGSGIMSFGIAAMMDINLSYLIDAHKEILGDGMVAVTFVRNAIATVIVFVLPPWLKGMGTYNMFALIGVLALASGLMFVPMMMYGKRVRIACASRYARYAQKQFNPRLIQSD